MHKKLKRDNQQRIIYCKNELLSLILKVFSQQSSDFLSKFAKYVFNSLKRYWKRFSLVKNFCILTQRGRAVYGNQKLSRMALKQIVWDRFYPGFHKAAW